MTEPEPVDKPPRESLRSRPSAIWLVVGAVVGGFLVGPFKLEPAWLWGMGGGLAGGLVGALAGWVASRKLPVLVRVLLVLTVLGSGFFLIWLVAGRQWILTPRSIGFS